MLHCVTLENYQISNKGRKCELTFPSPLGSFSSACESLISRDEVLGSFPLQISSLTLSIIDPTEGVMNPKKLGKIIDSHHSHEREKTAAD